MSNENKLVSDYMDLIAADTEEEGFLRSSPWILDAHPQSPDSLIRALRSETGRFKELSRQPKFSLLAVLRDTWPQHLNSLILSMRCQSYQDWELLLFDDGSTLRQHLDVARSWADRDGRIHLKTHSAPLGPSRAKNMALQDATGDFLIVADADGVLHPMALGVFARHINENLKVNFVFANQAEIDSHSTALTNFVLKPQWDVFTLLRIPYVGRLYGVGRDLLERATHGGRAFREEYDGIEEHDLWLRLALTGAVESQHAALFTYYRRTRSNVLARMSNEELIARRHRLLEEFVPRVYPGSAWKAKVHQDRDPLAATSVWLTDLPGIHRRKLLIIIPFKDQVDTTIQCLESIEKQEHRLDVVVALVNNRSSEERTLPSLRSWIDSPRASRYEILDQDCAFNFAKLNNAAVTRFGGDRDLILLLNNDVELSMPQTLQTMAMQLLADHSIGFIGIKLCYPGGEEVQHGGVVVCEQILGSGYNQFKHGRTPAEFVDAERISIAVTFACAMTRRETFEQLGGLDEIYLPNGFGDVDMCLRALELGFRNYYLGSLTGLHHESISRGSVDEDIDFSFLYERNGRTIASWRNRHLNRSYRYAWPLHVPPRPSICPPAEQSFGPPHAAPPGVPPGDWTATSWPLRYQLVDRLNQILKLRLGSLHGPFCSMVYRAGRGYRLLQQPGGVVRVGRRILGPLPLVEKVARAGVRRARRMRYHWRVWAGLFDVLRHNPGTAKLLAMGLRHGGVRGLGQSIQVLVPARNDVRPSPQEWFQSTRPSRWLLARFRHRRWPAQAPKFTIITPVYNVREEWLRQAVESVIDQTYPRWEMICVNDNSTAPHIRPVLDELSARDPRVRVFHCATNRGVSAATNLGLAQATGDYVAFMDHDDCLEPHALHRFAEVALQDGPDMIYSDEAMTDVDIKRIQFVAPRSSFSYDYYLSHPYFVHLIAARTEILRRVGGLNEDMTISQDVDLVLRLIEACRDIAHVPEVLYRWRTHPGSLGHRQKSKVYAMTRGALERHFKRLGLNVEFDDESHFNFRDVRFAIAKPAHVAIVVATKDQARLLRACIAGLERTMPADLAEIVIVEQVSEGPSVRSMLGDLAGRHKVVRHEKPFSLSAMFNRGAAAATATHYLFLHDDVEAINPGWIEHMLGYAQRADVGIVGATLLYREETIQHAGAVIGLNGAVDHAHKNGPFRVSELHRSAGTNGILLSSRDVSAVTAACMLVRADVFERLSGFDEELAVRYYDLDFCLRARALGYKVIQDAYAVLYHEENEGKAVAPGSQHFDELERFLTRHGDGFFAGDPFYSPLLSTGSTDMTLVATARTPAKPRWRTTPIVLPNRTNGTKSFRVDTISTPRPVAQAARPSLVADHSSEARQPRLRPDSPNCPC